MSKKVILIFTSFSYYILHWIWRRLCRGFFMHFCCLLFVCLFTRSWKHCFYIHENREKKCRPRTRTKVSHFGKCHIKADWNWLTENLRTGTWRSLVVWEHTIIASKDHQKHSRSGPEHEFFLLQEKILEVSWHKTRGSAPLTTGSTCGYLPMTGGGGVHHGPRRALIFYPGPDPQDTVCQGELPLLNFWLYGAVQPPNTWFWSETTTAAVPCCASPYL